jgi:hypothetical protein
VGIVYPVPVPVGIVYPVPVPVGPTIEVWLETGNGGVPVLVGTGKPVPVPVPGKPVAVLMPVGGPVV